MRRGTGHFGKGLFRFLSDLRENKDRAWFQRMGNAT
jgi:hypothetical protein